MSKDLIIKANALVEASYHLTANEQRLILSAIAQIPSNKTITDDEIYFVNPKDMERLGLNKTTVYRELYEAAERLFSRVVTVKLPAGTLKTRWVQDIWKINNELVQDIKNGFATGIDSEQVTIGIRFSKSVLPFLNNLTSNFTKYKLTEISGFSSAYSYRIYEFLMQYQSTGYIKISLNELRERLQLGEKYPASKDLKVRVIDIAIKEINEKSPYKVEYNLIKTGKKFTHLELRFKPKEKPKPLDQKDPNTIDIFDNLTDKEREIIAQKHAYADQIGATAEHRENLIRQGLETHRQAEQSEQERKQREKAERHAQEQQDKERLELAQRQFEQILADDRLINAYLVHNRISEKSCFGLQKVYYQQDNFRGVFEMEKHKFEQLNYLKHLNLKFLDK